MLQRESLLPGQRICLARYGAAHSGKYETRKELALLALFHANVFVCATSTAMQNHFLKHAMEALTYSDAPALLDIYTPCQGENGVADNVSARQARLAVESRMSPLFVHDPRRGENLHDWFSLEGNPDADKTWTTATLEYLDDEGCLRCVSRPAATLLSSRLTRKIFSRTWRLSSSSCVSPEPFAP